MLPRSEGLAWLLDGSDAGGPELLAPLGHQAAVTNGTALLMAFSHDGLKEHTHDH